MNLLLETQTTMKSQYSEEFIEQALAWLALASTQHEADSIDVAQRVLTG